MYENEINGLKSQIKQLKENHDMDLNVIEELKENINMLEADKQNMLDARDQLANKENEIRELNQKIKKLEIKLKEKNIINNMRYMFSGCESLSSLPDISNWITNNVKDMSYISNIIKFKIR